MTAKSFKMVMVGECGVGKSSLFLRFRDNRFLEILNRTLGLDYCQRSVKFTASDGNECEALINLWDTAGMERAGSMTNSYYSSCHAILLIYDVTEKCSLSSLRHWVENASTYTRGTPAVFVLAGNKIDEAASEIKVDETLVQKFAENLGIPVAGCYRISAKTGEGVSDMFSSVLAKVAAKLSPAEPAQRIFLRTYEDQPDGRACSAASVRCWPFN